MPVVTRPLTDFVTSGGIVAFDRLKLQIQQTPAITTPYFDGTPDVNDLSQVQLVFSAVPTAPELAALDAIIAAHSGVNLPAGHGWATSHTILTAVAGTLAVSFVDDTFTLLAGIGFKQARIARGPGLLESVVVKTSVGAAVTVQLLLNGALVGGGTAIVLAGGVASVFVIPIAETEYVTPQSELGVALTGLAVGSDTCVEAYWQEAF